MPDPVPPFSVATAQAYRLSTPTDLAAGVDGRIVYLQVDAAGNLRVTEGAAGLIEQRKIFLALCQIGGLDAEAIRTQAISSVTDDLLVAVPAQAVTGNPSGSPT